MPLKTTVIGSYPKPDYLQTPDWFRLSQKFKADEYENFISKIDTPDFENCEERAIKEVVEEQVQLGIDVITDGEVKRDNYINYFCRHLKGMDFENLTLMSFRNGASTNYLPTVIGELEPGTELPWIADEWRHVQSLTSVPVKVTIPGPMTIVTTTANKFYENPREQSLALVKCINREVRSLAEAGCKHIQIDEPVLVRDTQTALDYGIDHLEQCFEGIGAEVCKTVHLCCGYPYHLDQEDYLKADKNCYHEIAEKLDNTICDAVSIEDAHRHNDLSLLSMFKNTTVILGVVAIARSRVESEEEISQRVKAALEYIPAERLMLAPDCGLGYLPKQILQQKLTNMVRVAKSLS